MDLKIKLFILIGILLLPFIITGYVKLVNEWVESIGIIEKSPTQQD